MKKYVKPELFYEHYELSQHIADCAWEWVNLTNEAICAAEPDEVKNPVWTPGFDKADYMLFSNNQVCTFLSDWYTDYCYQSGAAHANLFKS